MSDLLDPLRIYDSAQVAALLHGKSLSWFYRHRRRLTACGFPRPCSPFGHPRWNGADLIAWLNRPKPAQTGPDGGGQVVDFSQMLAQRAAQVAPGAGAARGKRR